jgi:hypothetical protein
VILLYAKRKDRPALLCLGLLPENITRLKQGWPICRRLGQDIPELKNWGLFIGHNQSAVDDGTPTVNITFHGEALDRFTRRKLWEIPAEPPDLPFNITVFYAMDGEKLLSDLMESGVIIEHFTDKRGVTN